MDSHDTLQEIQSFTMAMVKLGLSNEQNFPSTHGNPKKNFEITVNENAALTLALKNISYREIYDSLSRANCFNVKLLDGTLICLRYRFNLGKITEHCLTYFPSPYLEHFQNDPDSYLLDEIYADNINRNIVPFPIRFDFNADTERYIEVHHPYSHLTLGQYQTCRLPVSSPVSPLVFGCFILRNFYNTTSHKFSDEFPNSILKFGQTISSKEQNIPHVVLTRSTGLII